MAIYAIGDIHGCRRTFQKMVERLAPGTEDTLVLLGDYIDRGPDSKGVLDFIFQLEQEDFTLHCLRGNHEQMCLDAANRGESRQQFYLVNGGAETIASFNAEHPRDVPGKYLYWMDQLPFYVELPGYLFVHAGLSFQQENPLEHLEPMIWIRDWYPKVNYDWLGDRIIVHGHTPVGKGIIKQQVRYLEETRIVDLDAGCVFSGYDLGHLCALELESRELFFEENLDVGNW